MRKKKRKSDLSRETLSREYYKRLLAGNELDVPVDESVNFTRTRYRKMKKEVIDRKLERFGRLTRTAVLTILMFSIALFLLIGKRPTVSKEENRNLATFPNFSIASYLSGDYTSAITEFYDDTVPLRSKFKSIISTINSAFGITYGGDDSVVLIGSGVASLETPKDTTENSTESTENAIAITEDTTAITTQVATTEEDTEEVDDNGEIDNNILIYNNRALMLYGGSFSKGEEYAGIINSYREDLGDDINIYSLIAPTAGTFYIPEKYKNLTNSETENIDHINSYLDDSIETVDVYNALVSHKSENIYARTDHHWLPLGAYYAAQAFADISGVDFAELDSYTSVTKEGYVGTMYGYTNGNETIKNNPEDFIYYQPSNNYTTTYYDHDLENKREGNLLINLDNVDPVSWYLVFMGGDDRITHVSTDVKNNRTLVIIKDSYGNALVPCLTSSFEDIYVIDMRYFEVNAIDFIKTVNATDLLFAMDTYSATGSNCDKLEEIRTQSSNCDIEEKLNADIDSE
jgi:hypothetical protein